MGLRWRALSSARQTTAAIFTWLHMMASDAFLASWLRAAAASAPTVTRNTSSAGSRAPVAISLLLHMMMTRRPGAFAHARPHHFAEQLSLP